MGIIVVQQNAVIFDKNLIPGGIAAFMQPEPAIFGVVTERKRHILPGNARTNDRGVGKTLCGLAKQKRGAAEKMRLGILFQDPPARLPVWPIGVFYRGEADVHSGF